MSRLKTNFVTILAGRPYPLPPVCLRLRHAVQAAGNAAAGRGRSTALLRDLIYGNVFEQSGVPRREFCRTAA